MRRAARMLASEELVTSADATAADIAGGPELFPKRVLRWFALMWVAVFSISSLEAKLDIRWQVAINLIGIFLGASLLMLRTYRLDPREALALRPVRPVVWLAVLVGAPSGLLVGIGVARLASYLLPVPEELVEQFGRELIPEGIPLWQLLLFLAVLPGVCEEIAFRGLLLHGLRRRFRPATLCLVVGCVFGFFHFALFRLVPTAFLGTILAAVTVATGSIFPAMLWHALNNGLPVAASSVPWLGAVGSKWWHSAVAVVPLALSLWTIWRFRTPYPGVGRRDRPDSRADS
jgi:sodium transport system permease protein